MMKNENTSLPLTDPCSNFKIIRNEVIEEMNKASCPLSEKEKSKLMTYLKLTRRNKNIELIAVKEL